MSESAKTNLVAYWLEAEEVAAPGSPIVATLKSATKSLKLDEGAILRKLRDLYNPATLSPPPEPDVTN